LRGSGSANPQSVHGFALASATRLAFSAALASPTPIREVHRSVVRGEQGIERLGNMARRSLESRAQIRRGSYLSPRTGVHIAHDSLSTRVFVGDPRALECPERLCPLAPLQPLKFRTRMHEFRRASTFSSSRVARGFPSPATLARRALSSGLWLAEDWRKGTGTSTIDSVRSQSSTRPTLASSSPWSAGPILRESAPNHKL
jgi:hypothetical protein